ncbi:SIR2 family NAD-dependent protein deacylase [Catenisphaera adipataccumulans]|uniref:NAD-dependent SIR2 family protein deacetylase n=1 Tax=Catenisphaera adipataccumulans TaxID=700500 RepID=A0A7W8FU25_9FIRM|nr:Sir2 silent information regulator family NAD-dependent deacetylase [Catenisphaera adipataccumulans]MBB5182154.1 NAD-dependent SIR2 family protein deacetylase [Catenisphaera adipataccumulans]
MILKKKVDKEKEIRKLHQALQEADSVIIGAGAGLSTSAGFTYTGKRFEKYFQDFEEKYGFHDMYSLGFYPYNSMEEFWGFWCRYIWINRYTLIPSDVYQNLLDLVKNKDYFVLTTNVDHCFQKSGFDKKRLFYTQGDYGLFQSSSPSGVSKKKTYDNYETIRKMVLSEGFQIADNGELIVPQNTKIKMTVPSALVPVCPDDGKLMTTNLRSDDTFVQDDGWYEAQNRYHDFLKSHQGMKTVFLEIGVGGNTPGIIKFNFWKRTYEWPHATYACLNLGEAFAPKEIEKKSICIDDDIGATLKKLKEWID